jgi:multidrug resistance efflux pump
MSIHFSRSLRRLEADGSRRSLLGLILTIAVLGLWTTWFVTARVAVYATTRSARLEVDRENHPVDAPVGGRVVVAPLAAGRNVTAGEILLELDAAPERFAKTEALAGMDPAARQIRSLRDELVAQQRAIEEELRSAQAANNESDSKVRESAAAAEMAVEEAKRSQSLQASGLVSELDALRAQKLAEERSSEAQTARFAAGRLTRDLEAREQDRLARIARLKNEIAAIEGTRNEALAASDRLGYEIEQRLVRAPIAGTVAETSALKVGSMVQVGDRICTIVPTGALKVVALFSPAVALGRVREGQSARVRLEGFPWTQYGSTPALVSHVAGELRDGQIRVELALNADVRSAIPFQHGLPAEVDVEVEQLSPMAMVLRSAGSRMRLNAAQASTVDAR